MDAVVIASPYRGEDCKAKAGAGQQAGALLRVKKVVSFIPCAVSFQALAARFAFQRDQKYLAGNRKLNLSINVVGERAQTIGR